MKLENSHLFIFDEIWPKSLYYSTGCLARFLSNFKNSKKSNFDWNQLKLPTQHKVHVYASENIIKMANSLLFIFDEIVQGLWPNF